MQQYPSIPSLASVPREHFEGNVWIQELVDGAHLRFTVGDGGYVTFGDRMRPLPDPVPLRYRAAVDHVRTALDVDRLFGEVEDPGAYTFFGVATVHQSLPYEWDRTPRFLGFDVWDGRRERWLAADTVVRVLEGLGLNAVNAFERELPARHFYPDRWEIPDSAWYDGPPAGIVVRDKHGNRARQDHPEFDPDAETRERHGDPETLAEETVTDARLQATTARLESAGRPVTFDTVYEGVVADVFRETRWTIAEDDPDELGAFRTVAAERVQRWLGERR